MATQVARKATTERAILDATLALYLERHESEPSLDDVAARAGVAKSTVLYHFQSRMGLLEALARRLYDEVVERTLPLDQYEDARAFVRVCLLDATRPATRVFQQISDQLLYAHRGPGLGRGMRSIISALEILGVTEGLAVKAAATQMAARRITFGDMDESDIEPFLDELFGPEP